MKGRLLLGVDRDGTIIKNDGYFAKDDHWADKLILNEVVLKFLAFLQNNYATTTIVLTNQSAVARRYFPERRVEEVNKALDKILKKRGIRVDNWQYCADVDRVYANKHPAVDWDKRYVKKITKRKPTPGMLLDGLKQIGKSLRNFENVLIIGDHEDDQNLAKNINAYFIDVNGKTHKQVLRDFDEINIF